MKTIINYMKTNPMVFLIGFIIFTICGSIFNKMVHQIYITVTG